MNEGFGIHRKSITVPRNWVGRVNGFSAHAARQGLLQFARDVEPANIHQIHEEAETIKTFRNFLQENTTAMVSAATKGVSVPIDWATAKSGLAPTEGRAADSDDTETIESAVAAQLTSESEVFSQEQEARIRELVREELARLALQD